MMNNYKLLNVILVGGLILNQKPLNGIINNFKVNTFIDINGLSISDVENAILMAVRLSNNHAVIVGYSTGGIIALKILPQIENLIYKLILINSTPRFIEDANWEGISQKNFNHLLNKLNNMSLSNFAQHFCNLSLFPEVVSHDKCQLLQSLLISKLNINYWLKIILEMDVRKNLQTISIPIAFIYSANDAIISDKNNINSPLITKYTLNKSTHAELNHLELIKYMSEFIQ